jgi:hypothetical protein
MEPVRPLSFRPTPPLFNLQETNGNPTADLASILLQMAYAPFAEALFRPARSVCPFPPQPAFGELGSSTTARSLEKETPSAAICCTGQIVLGDISAALAGMEASIDPRPDGDRHSLASSRIQVVLDVALAASEPLGKKMRQQEIARTDLPHGRPEPDLGYATHSW